MTLTSKLIEIEGIQIHYLEGGVSHHRQSCKVFLHGWALTSQAFLSMLDLLSRDHHIIALDLPGFGRSGSSPGFWGYEAYAQFIDAFLRKLDIRDADLIGQSMGGGICLATAALFPDRVRSLVLVNSAGIPMTNQPSFAARVSEIYAQYRQSSFRPENRRMLGEFFFNLIHHFRSLATSINLPVKHDLRPLLKRVDVPCLLAWGKYDTMLPLAFAEELGSRLKNSKLVVIDDGHHEWNLVYPERFVDLVNKFYDELHQ